ncbi:MAG: response regulator [Salibacteraceae bacterium]|nr:response regulator [Salibacteraceae bacterium]
MKRVFIVEDDPGHVYIRRKYLNKISDFVPVLEFANGQEAIDELFQIKDNEQLLPDIILLDINMPLMNGWQFLELFEKMDFKKRPTVYILSSLIRKKDKVKAESFKSVENIS